jgi:hypothetical protein
MLKKLLFTVVVLMEVNATYAQAESKYPKNYFRSPLDIPMSLSGNFGEIRPNHFHSGIDLRTNGREGLNTYAVADGYVSRIKVSPYGYGKALYITHPNGYVSVYGHLRAYNGAIEEYVKKAQYEKELFEVELFPAKDEIKVTKGQVIGFTGNTGSSGGPHLHFEIRDEKTEQPINPLYFGFIVPDTVKPRIKSVAVYPLEENSTVNGKQRPKIIKVSYANGKHTLKPADSVTVSGAVGFAVETFDGENNSPGPNGVHRVELHVDGSKVYSHVFETFAFDQTRYVNAHIDYPEKRASGQALQRSFLLKNNKLGIYHEVANRGVISFTDSAYHKVKYILSDINGNTTVLEMKVKSKPPRTAKLVYLADIEKKFDCMKESNFASDDIKVNIPANALYEDIEFRCSKSKDTLKGAIAPTHHVHDPDVPLHLPCTIMIKTKPIAHSLQSKALVVSLNEKRSSEGGEYLDGWVTAQVKSFGKFTVMLDTIAPSIAPVNIAPGKVLTKARTISVKISDNLSGIKKYRATVDGKWILMEYEPKQSMLYYTFDEKVGSGQHTFNLEVTDAKGNTAKYEAKFRR